MFAHGSVNFTGIETTVNQTAPVYCENGYEIQGDPHITCHSDGHWRSFSRCRIKSTYVFLYFSC